MHAVKFTIPGSFWDSQIYSGHLYLFTDDGEINVIDWRKTIGKITDRYKHLQLVLRVAFLESNLLYTRSANLMLRDEEISFILNSRFAELAQLDLTFKSVSDSILEPSKQDNPFPFPHTDSEIYYNRIYVGLKSGIFSSECRTSSKKTLERKVERHWDGAVLSIAGSHGYTTLALASGQAGLYELKVDPKEKLHSEPDPLAYLHCNSCDWLYYSIYGSSHIQPSFLASFKKDPIVSRSTPKKYERKLEEIISSEEVFNGTRGFSWGAHDKIYSYHDGLIDVISYDPAQKDSRFQSRGHSISLSAWKGDVVSASVAPFGMVIECENALVIAKSDGEITTIPGEPAGWRIFPRTENYTNQLHIIYDDRLEIWSFNHDYFVNQKDKIFGSKASSLDDK